MKQLLQGLYDFDTTDNCFIIKIAPEKYVDLFNKLDHYPMRKRDIDQNVISYIEDCSNDIPLKNRIKIEIKIKGEPQKSDVEERTTKGLVGFFKYSLHYYKKQNEAVTRTSSLYVVLFVLLTLLTFYLEAKRYYVDRILFKTILEGCSIGSWVFLWEAIAGMLIKNKKNRFMIKTYKRLASSGIYYVYGAENNPAAALP